jgi:hypothetical protein
MSAELKPKAQSEREFYSVPLLWGERGSEATRVPIQNR